MRNYDSYSQLSQKKGQPSLSLHKGEIFCMEYISVEWIISIFMLSELKNKKLKATQKQIQNQREARTETMGLKPLVF